MIVAVGNFTPLGFRLAFYMLVSLLIGMSVREYARASAAVRLGDPTPRLWGRLTLQLLLPVVPRSRPPRHRRNHSA